MIIWKDATFFSHSPNTAGEVFFWLAGFSDPLQVDVVDQALWLQDRPVFEWMEVVD